jgi:hypothetical protein
MTNAPVEVVYGSGRISYVNKQSKLPEKYTKVWVE